MKYAIPALTGEGVNNIVDYNKKNLSFSEHCLPYFPSLARDLKSRSCALFVQQVHYWLGKDCGEIREGKRWIYNSYENWAAQLGYSIANIRKIVKKLEKLGILLSRIEWARRGKNKLRKWYTIDYSKLNDYAKFIKNNKDQTSHNKNLALLKVLESSSSNNKDNKFINKLSPAHAVLILKNMIDIWNTCVHRGKKPVQLTKRNMFKLKRRLERVFEGNIENWQSYCTLIAGNDFLMGGGQRGWKATLHWALDEGNIQKVLSDYYSKHRSSAMTENFVSPEQKLIDAKKEEKYKLKSKKSLLENTIEHIHHDVELERKKLTNKNYETLSLEARERYKKLFEEQNNAKNDPHFWDAISRSIFEMFLRAKMEEESFEETVDSYLEKLPRVKELRKEIGDIDITLQKLETDIQAVESEMNKPKNNTMFTCQFLKAFSDTHKKVTETMRGIVLNHPALRHAQEMG